ncbi:hypothetical protein EVAR_6587_1 [Eumeta japonica]|uniref:Uncharacterized protein n=1 Tax=Eumeta variegata TaxID=151549 RepID=A0A4C1SQH7_EUMVA|nr:hypothetical protein EVAR_6587_1 [Eumeta japonica]
MEENWHSGEKKEGSGSVKLAHYIVRRQLRAAKFRALYYAVLYFMDVNIRHAKGGGDTRRIRVDDYSKARHWLAMRAARGQPRHALPASATVLHTSPPDPDTA